MWKRRVWSHDPGSRMNRITHATARWSAAVLALIGAPYAGFTALVHHAPWPAHWVEPVVLFVLPAACIPLLAGNLNPRSGPRTWAGLVVIWAVGVLSSPHADLSGSVSVGHNLRILVNEIALVPRGGFEPTPYRIARFSVSALAMVMLVSVITYHLMAFLQRAHDFSQSKVRVRPTRVLSDAEWATQDEVRRRFSTEGGIILGELTDPRRNGEFDAGDRESWGRQGKGRLITLDPGKGNAHSLIFSGSGSYKSVGVAIPNALTYAGPLIVIDPKGEIYDRTAGVRQASGRNPWLITAEAGLDPIKLLTTISPGDGTVFSDLAEFMLITSGEDRSDAAAFFHRKALRLLTALLAHLHDLGRDRNIPAAAYRWLARPPDVIRAEFLEAAEEYRKGGSGEDYVSVGLSEMAHTEDRQFSSIVATVVNGLEWAGKTTTRGFVESRDLPGPKLVERVLDPTTDIYIRIPTEVSQSWPEIARVLIGSLVRAIRAAVSGTADGDLDHRLFIIDEARALRRMDHLVSIRDEARAYGIHLMQIFQSYQQLVECYGVHGAGAWENSVDAVVIGPVHNAVQAQALSRMIGKRTVVTASSSRQRNSQIFMPFSGSAGSSVSNQLRETELIQPSELRKLPPESAIILATGTAPIRASKAIWFTRNDMLELVKGADNGKDGNGASGAHHVPGSGRARDEDASSGGSHAGPGLRPEPGRPVCLGSAGPSATRNQPGSAGKTGTADRAGGRPLPEGSVDETGLRDPGQRCPPGRVTDGCEEANDRSESSETAGNAGRKDESAGLRPIDAAGKSAPTAHVIGDQDGGALARDLPDDLGSIEEDMAKLLPGSKREPKREWKAKQKAIQDPQPDRTGVDLKARERVAAAVNSRAAGSAHKTIQDDGTCSDVHGAAQVPASDDHARTGRTNACPASATAEERVGCVAEKTDGHGTEAEKDGRLVVSGTGSNSVSPGRGRFWRFFWQVIRNGAKLLSVPGVRRAGPECSGPLTTEPLSPGWPSLGVECEHGEPAWAPDVFGDEFDHSGNAHMHEAGSPDVRADVREGDRNDRDLRGLGAAIHRNIVYDSLIERSIALDANTNEIARQVLSEPFLRKPPGTSVGIVLPDALGPGIDHPDHLSIVFIPDDRSSPIHRILVNERGKIVGTAGPYRRDS